MPGTTGCSAEAFEALKASLWDFMEHEIYPTEQEYMRQCHEMGAAPSNEWTHAPILIDLMHKAKSLGLWNMFLPIDSARAAGDTIGRLGYGLTNRQYAEICEILGTCSPVEYAAQATNCGSPDTGNMEVFQFESRERLIAFRGRCLHGMELQRSESSGCYRCSKAVFAQRLQ